MLEHESYRYFGVILQFAASNATMHTYVSPSCYSEKSVVGYVRHKALIRLSLHQQEKLRPLDLAL